MLTYQSLGFMPLSRRVCLCQCTLTFSFLFWSAASDSAIFRVPFSSVEHFLHGALQLHGDNMVLAVLCFLAPSQLGNTPLREIQVRTCDHILALQEQRGGSGTET